MTTREKRYIGKVELDGMNATATIWEVTQVEPMENVKIDLVLVFDIAGSPGWTWAFGVNGRELVPVKAEDKGYKEIYAHCQGERNWEDYEYEGGFEKWEAETVKVHGEVLETAIETGFIELG